MEIETAAEQTWIASISIISISLSLTLSQLVFLSFKLSQMKERFQRGWIVYNVTSDLPYNFKYNKVCNKLLSKEKKIKV